MTVTLVPNQYPAGARDGSPITIINKQTDQGVNNLSAGVQIPASAQPGDFIVCLFWSGGNGAITAAFFASDIMTIVPGSPKIGLGTNNCSLFMLYYTVKDGDQGTTANLTWTYAGGTATYALIAYTFRYVQGIDFFGPGFPSGVDSGLADTGHVVVPHGNNLVFAGTGAGAINRTGTEIQDVPGWYETVKSGGTLGLASIAGIVDISYPYTWGGLALNILQGGPVNGSFAGWGLSLRAVQPPSGPAVTMSPSGSSIDMAGVSGVRPTVSWSYTPTGGQGPQNGWGIGRHVHGTGANTGYWNAGTQTWQPTQFVNYGSDTSVTFPAGSWVNDGTNWDLFVFIQESALNLLSALSTAKTFVASPPTATVTVTGPTGTTALPKPAVTWTRSLGSGATQAFYRVKVFTQAQTLAGGFDPNVTVPVVDSTKTAGTVLTWTLSKALVPGVYVAYAQLTTNFGQATLWTAGAAFTVAYSQPTAAGVTALVGAGP